MKYLFSVFLISLFAPLAMGGAATSRNSDRGSPFKLLPKSFQKKPEMEMTVMTEMTAAGLKVQRPNANTPVYYETVDPVYHEEGGGGGGKKIPVDQLKGLVQKALSSQSYLAATPEHKPTILVLFQWGFHGMVKDDQYTNGDIHDLFIWANGFGNRFGMEVAYDVKYVPEKRFLWVNVSEQERQNLLTRASLIGGTIFARELQEVLRATDMLRDNGPRVGSRGYTPIGLPEALSVDEDSLLPRPLGTPMDGFLKKNQKTKELFDQAYGEIYFVVATAYDYASLDKKDKAILWRTKMTVNANGVSMQEALPELVAETAPYIGREMKEPALLTGMVRRDAKVEIGTLKIVPVEKDKTPGDGKK